MENGKIQKNEKLLSTLENLHHIFFTTKEGKLKIYRVHNGDITEVIKNQTNSDENNDNKNISFNDSLISNNNYNEEKIMTNSKNDNIIFKEKESIQNNNILNLKEITNKSNLFNFDQNILNNIYPSPTQLYDTPKEIKNINNVDIKANIKNTKNQTFSFENICPSPNNNIFNYSNYSNIKNLNNNNKKNDINDNNDNKFYYSGLSSMFRQ